MTRMEASYPNSDAVAAAAASCGTKHRVLWWDAAGNPAQQNGIEPVWEYREANGGEFVSVTGEAYVDANEAAPTPAPAPKTTYRFADYAHLLRNNDGSLNPEGAAEIDAIYQKAGSPPVDADGVKLTNTGQPSGDGPGVAQENGDGAAPAPVATPIDQQGQNGDLVQSLGLGGIVKDGGEKSVHSNGFATGIVSVLFHTGSFVGFGRFSIGPYGGSARKRVSLSTTPANMNDTLLMDGADNATIPFCVGVAVPAGYEDTVVLLPNTVYYLNVQNILPLEAPTEDFFVELKA